MNLLDHLRPLTLAQLIAELIADEADEDGDFGEFNFRTEAAKNAYANLLAAGLRNCDDTEFFDMIETAVDFEFGRQETN